MRTFRPRGGKKRFKSKYQRKTIDDDLVVTKSVFKGKGFVNHNLYKPTRGEQNIIDFLSLNKVKYTREKKFSKLINPFTKQPLRMDFYLPDKKICIEFDGKQHFEVVKRFNMTTNSLNYQQVKDSIKDEFCKNKGLKLIRISYKDINNIPTILSFLCA